MEGWWLPCCEKGHRELVSFDDGARGAIAQRLATLHLSAPDEYRAENDRLTREAGVCDGHR